MLFLPQFRGDGKERRKSRGGIKRPKGKKVNKWRKKGKRHNREGIDLSEKEEAGDKKMKTRRKNVMQLE